MLANKPHSAVSIGAIFGGPEFYECATAQVIGRVSLEFSKTPAEKLALRSGQIALTFAVPGSISPLENSGLHLGRLLKKQRRLELRAFVPARYRWTRRPLRLGAPDPNIPSATQARDLLAFVFMMLRESVSLAAPRFAAANITFAEKQILELISQVEQRLTSDVPEIHKSLLE